MTDVTRMQDVEPAMAVNRVLPVRLKLAHLGYECVELDDLGTRIGSHRNEIRFMSLTL